MIADLATERERQLMTARANQTTDLTNGERQTAVTGCSVYSFPRAFPSSTDLPVLLLDQNGELVCVVPGALKVSIIF